MKPVWKVHAVYRVLGGHEITALGVDLLNERYIRVALGSWDGGIQVLTIANDLSIHFGWRILMEETIPIKVAYADNGSKDLVVFSFGNCTV